MYRRLVGVQLRSQLQYPVAFVFDLVGTALTTVLEFGAIFLVIWRFESIGGWSIYEVAFLYGMAEMSFGVMDMLFSGFDPQTFGQNVRRGSFDQVLLRPINVTFQVLGSRFVLRRIGKSVLGVGLFAFGLANTEVSWTAVKVLYVPVVVASQVAFFGGLFMVGSTITFWTVESIEVMNIFTYGGKEMQSYPMHIYPRWMRMFFTFIVPAIFLNYYPAILILDLPDPLGMPWFAPYLSPVAGLGVFVAANAFWRLGIRHYRSTGS